MFWSIVYRCPYLKGSNDGARCDAVLWNVESNLIKYIDDANIKLCINTKRRFEACYIYRDKLRGTDISMLHLEISLTDSRHLAFSSHVKCNK